MMDTFFEFGSSADKLNHVKELDNCKKAPVIELDEEEDQNPEGTESALKN